MTKYKTLPGDKLEIVLPYGQEIEPCENDFGTITLENEVPYLSFKKLQALNGKIWEEVHSGNVNPIKLPCKLSPYTFFRVPATDEMSHLPKN